MEAEILKTVGQIAGIGGLALGVFLLLFRELLRKSIFPTLTKERAYRLLLVIALLVWSVALAGIGTWAWVEMNPTVSQITHGDGAPAIHGVGGDVIINNITPRP